ncbi:hypothetical protein SAMN04488062_1187 [Flavobacterium omnivorum]|uniref:Uncharacterized protein n=1 Tax=Flavobacterium omnivorum TaxID=178355 RepID=A0A1G8GFE2_9FLAO|nr:hypothetical protein [Flavobacterium omnivorum]SDH93112.1 hypothetical protein SAMN04488062_1187 [Flavobacterium omnivorum]
MIAFSATAQEENCDEVLVLLQVKYIGSREISSVICGSDVYLSIPEVLDFIKIRNTPNSNFTVINGFFINQNNTFKIDQNTNTIFYKEEVFTLKPSDFIRTSTNLFLKASYFNQIFGLENSFSFRSLSVEMTSKLELPAIKEARLQAMRDNLNKIKQEFIADTTIVREKPLFHFGTANWAVNTIQQSEGGHSERILLNLGGIVAGGELTTSLNYTNNQPIAAKNQFYRWRYVNNDNKYIKQLTLGKISAPSKATILFPFVGAQITNASTRIRKSFGTYILSDHTQANWTVELYINNVLIDYLQADTNGFFSFNVPLMYGRTEVTLRYYGPWGEEQFFSNQFVVPALFLPKKEIEYTISSGIIEDGRGSIFTNAKVNYGLSNYITLGGGLEYISSLESNKSIPFLNSSFRLSSQLFLTASYYSKVLYDLNLNYTTPKNLRFDFDYIKYDKNQEAVRFNYSEMRKASISMPIRSSFFSGTSRFNIQHNRFNTSKFTTSEFLLSGSSHGFNFNFTTNAFFIKNQKPLVFSTISTSFQLPKRFVLVPQLRYGYDASIMTTLQTQLRKPIFKKGFIQASFDYNFKNKNSSFQIGFTHNFDKINTGFLSIFNNNSASFSQYAIGSLMFEPQADFVSFNNRISVGRASVKFVPFLDSNGNGKKEVKEPLVTGVKIVLMGGDRHIVNADGTTIITGLEPYSNNYVELNTSKINSIAWRIKNKTLNCTLNPNELKIIEIPVIVVGEVSGMVYQKVNDQLLGIGGLKVVIYDLKDILITDILSEPDGYFSFLGLKSGKYSAKIDSHQLENLQMMAAPSAQNFEIDNGIDGAFIDTLEFVLEKNK